MMQWSTIELICQTGTKKKQHSSSREDSPEKQKNKSVLNCPEMDHTISGHTERNKDLNEYEKVNGKNIVFEQVVFEVTRRCNLNCLHCAKGESQPVTMSKKIIDAAADQLQGHVIENLFLFGGEPTLAVDTIEYLIRKIIEKNIKIMSVTMSTNGSIRSEKMCELLNRIGDYIASIYPEFYGTTYHDWLDQLDEIKKDYYSAFYGTFGTVEISTYEHLNGEEARKSYDFYRKNLNPDHWAVSWQDDRLTARAKLSEYNVKNYVYAGNAVKNFELLRSKIDFRIKEKKGALREVNRNILTTPILISANGNVCNSTLVSYEQADSDLKICNILTDNMYEKMNIWNFRYPLNRQQRKRKEKAEIIIWNHEHGMKCVSREYPEETAITPEKLKAAKKNLEMFDIIEDAKRKCHDEFPYLTFDECSILGDTILEYQSDGEYLKNDISGYKQSDNYTYDQAQTEETINAYIQINAERAGSNERVVAGMGILLGGLLKIMQHTKK